jgi:hypothetical protein
MTGRAGRDRHGHGPGRPNARKGPNGHPEYGESNAHDTHDEHDAQDAQLNDLTGNGIVNNGPDNELSGLGSDESTLRRLLHSAVDDLEPADGVLDHLHRAVPVRRARKRQALVGVAAAALLFGTAIPAFVHVANSGGAADDRAVNTGSGRQTPGGTDGDQGKGGDGRNSGAPSDPATDGPGTPDSTKRPDGSGTGGSGSGPGGDVNGPAGTYDLATACDPAQLSATTVAGAPDASGTVYGTFRVANVSTADCSVSSPGSVGFQAMGAADPSQIKVVNHVPGDPASGLPDPSQESATLLLKPNAAYEVKFAWVPSETCPTGNESPDPTPSDGDGTGVSGGTSGGSGGGTGPDAGTPTGSDSTDTSPQLLRDGGTQEGSVSVSHVPEPGAPTTGTTIPNACAGTIYRTGVIDAP